MIYIDKDDNSNVAGVSDANKLIENIPNKVKNFLDTKEEFNKREGDQMLFHNKLSLYLNTTFIEFSIKKYVKSNEKLSFQLNYQSKCAILYNVLL